MVEATIKNIDNTEENSQSQPILCNLYKNVHVPDTQSDLAIQLPGGSITIAGPVSPFSDAGDEIIIGGIDIQRNMLDCSLLNSK